MLIRFLAAIVCVSWIAAALAWLAIPAAVFVIAAKAAPCVQVTQRPEPSSLVLATGDLDFRPEPTTLGTRGGPNAAARPLHHRHGHHHLRRGAHR